jgi:hypothetical protein
LPLQYIGFNPKPELTASAPTKRSYLTASEAEFGEKIKVIA